MQAQACFRVHLRPRCDEGFELVGRRRLDGGVSGIATDFPDGTVIDRARRPSEIGEDVLIVRPPSVRHHGLDKGYFPTLKSCCHGDGQAWSDGLQGVVQDGFQQAGAGLFAHGDAGFELIAQDHQFIDLGDNAVLFGKRGERDPHIL